MCESGGNLVRGCSRPTVKATKLSYPHSLGRHGVFYCAPPDVCRGAVGYKIGSPKSNGVILYCDLLTPRHVPSLMTVFLCKKKEGKMKTVVSIIGTFIATAAFATNDGRDTVTSQQFVENELSNRQDLVQPKSGDKAITAPVAPEAKGAIGEREIKTTLGNESTNQSDPGLTTVGTVKAAIDTKQEKLKKYPAGVNVVTYTGTNNDQHATSGEYGAGITTITPIYDETVNTYGNGLVRAETLNTAVQRGIQRSLRQVPAGFVINKIGDVLPTMIYASASDEPTSYCYKRITEDLSQNLTSPRNNCSKSLHDDMKKGEWAVVMPKATKIKYDGIDGGCNKSGTGGASCGKEIRGISACSSEIFTDLAYAIMAPNENGLWDKLETAFNKYKESGTPTGNERYCYCKITDPHSGMETAASPWVFRLAYSTAGACALDCARDCAGYVRLHSRFRSAIFGAQSVGE